MEEVNIIRPQEGYQMKCLSSSADIVIGGGAAGVGKTFSLLLEPLRHVYNSGFGGVFFRRTTPQIKAEGGLWDASQKLYRLLDGAKAKEHTSEWTFPEGAKLKFSHLEHEKNKYDWQGSEIAFLAFDELTHFTKSMFFYLLTRNRSTSGVKPYVRATCNPDPDSWVAELISWWIGEDGFPIPEREGVLQYFVVDGDNYIFGDTYEDVYEKAEYLLKPMIEKSGKKKEDFIKSLTFISGSIYDNKALLDIDPGYLGNLNAQDKETKAQLLDGNWKVVISDNDIYDYHAFRDVFTNEHVKEHNSKYITSDIALEGSDNMVIMVWKGWVVIDIIIVPKADGNQALEHIKKAAKKHAVPFRNIAYDDDGIGGYLGGFLNTATQFNNGGKPYGGENYANLKTQCFYSSGKRIKNNETYILPSVANKMYNSKRTIKQQFLHERKAIKKAKADHDGKKKIIDKSEMKTYLQNKSPDLIETFMMREVFDLKTKFITSHPGFAQN